MLHCSVRSNLRTSTHPGKGNKICQPTDIHNLRATSIALDRGLVRRWYLLFIFIYSSVFALFLTFLMHYTLLFQGHHRHVLSGDIEIEVHMVSLDLEPWKRRKTVPSGTITEFNFGLYSHLFGFGYDFHIFLSLLLFWIFLYYPQRSHMSLIPHFPYHPQYRLMFLLYPFHFYF